MAQEKAEDTISCTHRYNKARELFIKTLYSKSAMFAQKLGDQYQDKLNFFGDSTVLATKESNLKWAAEHIEITDFENYEAAVREYEAMESAVADQLAKNSEFYYYIIYCAMYHKDYSPMPDVYQDVRSSNPELFTLYKKYE